jgi:TrkA-N domain
MTTRSNLRLALVALALAALALPLGTWGYWLVLSPSQVAQPTAAALTDALYRALQLFVLNREDPPGTLNWQVQLARFMAPASTLSGVWLALSSMRRQFRLHWRAWSGDHHLVCGLGRKGMATLRGSAHPVIAIERHGEPADVADLDARCVPLLRGSATDRNLLLTAGVRRARRLTIACGNDDEDVRIARLAIQLIAEHTLRARKPTRGNAPTSRADESGTPSQQEVGPEARTVDIAPHLDDAAARALMRHHVDAVNRRLGMAGLRFQYIDYCHQEAAARHLWSTHPLDREPIGPKSKSYPHLVLIGFGRMGQAALRKALVIAHYPNGELLRVDIFDAHANKLWRHFCGRHPNFDDRSLPPVAEVNLHEGNVIDRQQLAAIAEIAQNEHGQVTIVVAVDTEAEAALIVSRLPQVVAEREVPVCVRVEGPGGLAELMADRLEPLSGEPPHRKRPRVHLFGYIEATVPTPELIAKGDALAEALHAKYLQRSGTKPPQRRSHLPWPQLDEEFRESNRRAADLVPVLFRSFGYVIVAAARMTPEQARDRLHPDAGLPAEMVHFMKQVEHFSWYTERYLAGWTRPDPTNLMPRRAGANKGGSPSADEAFAKGQHDCLRVWHQLPEAEKEKDVQQVQSYLRELDKLGLAVVKPQPKADPTDRPA